MLPHKLLKEDKIINKVYKRNLNKPFHSYNELNLNLPTSIKIIF